jgi:hypothetical protein
MLLVALLLSAQAIDPPDLLEVHLSRNGAACVGAAVYTLPLRDAQLRTNLGDPARVLPVKVPCARLDAIDALLALPSNLSGKVTVRTEEVTIARDTLGDCSASLIRTLTPVDTDVLEARGVQRISQRIPSVACTRLAQALVGAQIPKNVALDWPSRLAALPLAVEP